MLKEFIKKFCDEAIVQDFIKINNEYFSINNSLKQIMSNIKTQPSFAGIPLGRQKGQNFVPSLYLLKKISKLSDKKIVVDDKGAWMFICGKDIFTKSITKSQKECDLGNFVLVENEFGECLGYGKFVANQKGIAVQHSFDIGDFLRRERA